MTPEQLAALEERAEKAEARIQELDSKCQDYIVRLERAEARIAVLREALEELMGEGKVDPALAALATPDPAAQALLDRLEKAEALTADFKRLYEMARDYPKTNSNPILLDQLAKADILAIAIHAWDFRGGFWTEVQKSLASYIDARGKNINEL